VTAAQSGFPQKNRRTGDTAERVVRLLQDRLNSLNDLALTLKHVHWNVTGPNFNAVAHEQSAADRAGQR
jgi:DNA-binding ferritin-like protein